MGDSYKGITLLLQSSHEGSIPSLSTTGGSSNGKMRNFEFRHGGSNPSLPAYVSGVMHNVPRGRLTSHPMKEVTDTARQYSTTESAPAREAGDKGSNPFIDALRVSSSAVEQEAVTFEVGGSNPS